MKRTFLAALLLLGSLSAATPQAGQPVGPGYAIGTWTATFIGSGTAGTGQTYISQSGSYEQIGRIVIVRFDLNMSSLGTAAGNAIVGGLPIAAAGERGGCTTAFTNMNGTSPPTALIGVIDPSSSTSQIQLYGIAAAPSALTITQAGAAFRMIATCIYHS